MGDGTFTISSIAVTQHPNTQSTVTFDFTTLNMSDSLVFDVAFNNGKPGSLNANLSGTVTMEESGTLLPADDPFCQQFEGGAPDGCANLNINSGTLTGAGPFNSTTIKGKNPTKTVEGVDDGIVICVTWQFSPPNSTPFILLDLPSPTFINGNDVVIHGDFSACLAPVGGTTDLLVGNSGGEFPYAPVAGGLAAAILTLLSGGWYVRRRFVRR
jgi:hypothetical protein